nr:Fic family protein [Corynebacterium imitans]
MLLAMHSVLLQDSAPEIAGKLREQAVWIGGPDDHHPGGALFVPLHQEHVPALLEDLEAFVARRDVPALAQAAIAHAQLETIRPFADGNGRTGRALVHVLLKSRGLSANVSCLRAFWTRSPTTFWTGCLRAFWTFPVAERLNGFRYRKTPRAGCPRVP